MAAKVEILRVGAKVRTNKVGIVTAMAAAVRRWGTRGQLGVPQTTEMGRLTGGRC